MRPPDDGRPPAADDRRSCSRRDPCVVGEQQVAVVERRLHELRASGRCADAAHRAVGACTTSARHRASGSSSIHTRPAGDRASSLGFAVEADRAVIEHDDAAAERRHLVGEMGRHDHAPVRARRPTARSAGAAAARDRDRRSARRARAARAIRSARPRSPPGAACRPTSTGSGDACRPSDRPSSSTRRTSS